MLKKLKIASAKYALLAIGLFTVSFMPATASAAWAKVGNFHGCVVFNKHLTKVRNVIYSEAKIDCRWSAFHDEILQTTLEHSLTSKAPGPRQGWKVESQSRFQRGRDFLQTKTASGRHCDNRGGNYREWSGETYVSVTLRDDSRTFGRNLRNWRAYRSYSCP